MPKILSNNVLYDSSPWYLIGKDYKQPNGKFYHQRPLHSFLEHYKENIAKC